MAAKPPLATHPGPPTTGSDQDRRMASDTFRRASGIVANHGGSAGGEVSAFHAGGTDAATVGGAVAPGDGYRSVSTGGRRPPERTREHPGPSALCCRREEIGRAHV